MFVDFSEVRQKEESLALKIDCVYHLEADASYQVYHKPFLSEKKVLLMVTGGNGFLSMKGKEFELKQGDVLLLCPGENDFFYRTIGERWDFWWFEFYSEDFLWEMDKCFHIKPDFLLGSQCETCITLLKQGKAGYASSALGGVLAELLYRIGRAENRDEKKELFYKAQQMIHQKLPIVTVAQVAAATGTGERELRSLFWEYAGCSPKKYIMCEKLEMACFLLKNTSKSIGEVSEELGFSSQFHFSRVFKECVGNSPSIWRRK